MMRSTMRALIIAAAAMGLGATAVQASGEAIELPARNWSWQGGWNNVFGSFDRAQLQRGLQIYTEVCSGCHSLKLVTYRNLAALGYSEDEVKAYAAAHEVQDGPNDDGEMFMRPALPSDRFVSPFANDQAARASNNGALPPDLSLIVKARKGGANYIFGILTGYEEAPEGFVVSEGMNYNHYFAGHQIAMAQPLMDDVVTYADGTAATTEQLASDITAFLAWTAEPELEARKSMGVKVMIFLAFFTILLIAVKRRVWADVKH